MVSRLVPLLPVFLAGCLFQSEPESKSAYRNIPFEPGPDVIFYDNFESGDLSRWDDVGRPECEVTTNPKLVYNGRHAIRAHFRKGESRAGGPIKWFMPGYEEVYVRWYLMFETGFVVENDLHHLRVKGNNIHDKWSGFAGAGERPNGYDRFSVGVDPCTKWKRYPGPGFLHFYTYHPDMPMDIHTGKFWGDTTDPEEPLLLRTNKWYCVEIRVRVNDIGKKNGIEEMWINGVKVISRKNLRFRDTEELLCNAVFLCFWMTEPPEHDQYMDCDELVVSRSYIGPLPAK